MTDTDLVHTRSGLAASVGRSAKQRGLQVATAESLTGGLLAADLAQTPGAASWFRGGVVAYSAEVKRDVLFVRPGPVVSERAVLDMADGVALLLGANTTVAVSGVAGPGSLEGKRPGTVWFAVRNGSTTTAELRDLSGDPGEICDQTCAIALSLLLRRLTPTEDAQGFDDRR